ncbi:3-oxoacyl-[acyl-carrier protein] reductase [Neorhizobium galegae]|uniref:SDR family NAD(P)-dependent oxidoreductase n=1 Tax=Neorhizobium galegae TaxID=399 RepID=UPI0027809E35|nr:SDR family oxidoreductase [Neorhizobium galegae]MDQ0137673.1 3-oxoacyl-[acyl-carrier protein] reductase [Neorhizobium galegae]
MTDTIMIPDLKGKRALVTGSTMGIGAAVAKALAAHGASVAINGATHAERGQAIVDDIRRAGGTAELVMGDLSKRGEPEKVVAAVADAFSGLDILINNAGGIINRTLIGDITDDFFDQVLDLNIRALVMTTKASAAQFRKNETGGVIINTTSIAARNGGGPGGSLYASSKAFISNFTRSMARELAPDNIRVNAISPGTVATETNLKYHTPEMLERTRLTIPMQRVGVEEDCIGTYLYLASESLSGYVTGQVIELNGGQIM